ncbi:hypothetical protein MPEAHAMD_3525 [Methylobacterium frigidaeris]|uniref:Uncharacterized protein n=1 Tax=Methylobacterium frigidaeris TaxID=2038277 RepID=A0AA37HCK3_9HYPH|nr:hypothetical protein MPEAHAMD_3525 [Methylobacterium frigidaeris]
MVSHRRGPLEVLADQLAQLFGRVVIWVLAKVPSPTRFTLLGTLLGRHTSCQASGTAAMRRHIDPSWSCQTLRTRGRRPSGVSIGSTSGWAGSKPKVMKNRAFGPPWDDRRSTNNERACCRAPRGQASTRPRSRHRAPDTGEIGSLHRRERPHRLRKLDVVGLAPLHTATTVPSVTAAIVSPSSVVTSAMTRTSSSSRSRAPGSAFRNVQDTSIDMRAGYRMGAAVQATPTPPP